MDFLSHVECSVCHDAHDPKELLTVCAQCGQMLWVRYHLERVGAAVSKEELQRRPAGMYRFRELTPLDDGEEPVSLGEGSTPLLAVTRARTLGVKGLILPSAGNAGGAAAVYGARAGLPVAVVVPRDTPPVALAEAILAGAHVFTVEGPIATAGNVVATVAHALGWFDLSTLKEPYRLEGKKTMGLELAEQLDWVAPDLLLYPTGGGTGLLGIRKAFQELATLGWVKDRPPRLVAVQAEGCSPVVKAWAEGSPTTTPWENPLTDAPGLRVPSPFAGRQVLEALRATDGEAWAVSEAGLARNMQSMTKADLVSDVAKTSGLTRPEAEAVVQTVLASPWQNYVF